MMGSRLLWSRCRFVRGGAVWGAGRGREVKLVDVGREEEEEGMEERWRSESV